MLRVARVRCTGADDDTTTAELLEQFGTTSAGADEAYGVAEEAKKRPSSFPGRGASALVEHSSTNSQRQGTMFPMG